MIYFKLNLHLDTIVKYLLITVNIDKEITIINNIIIIRCDNNETVSVSSSDGDRY